MTSLMGPPPLSPPPSEAATSDSVAASSADVQPSPQPEPTTSSPSAQETPCAMKPPLMAPPPPRNPNSSPPRSSSTDEESSKLDSNSARTTLEDNSTDDADAPKVDRTKVSRLQSDPVPYKIPPWSAAPCHAYSLEVLKDGIIIDQLDVYAKGAYMFGRADICDFVLEHPSISRFHAVIQFKETGDAYLYDLGSTHGSSINKKPVKKKAYVDLHVGDVLRFGNSTRLYIVQGPTELMPPERDLNAIRYAKQQQEMRDREASLRRAREEAARADGISWGMGEDAIEEVEDDSEEITWQTFKGELTEKQEKTRSKVLKRLEKIAHMKKEIDAIRVKDIPQGGLTQGQQTQIARNEQRISQLLEELESLEETLNDSIRESLGARTGSILSGKKKGVPEDEEELLSDDDEFYDRTKIKKPSTNKAGNNQSVETADTLLDKSEAIMKEMEEKTKLLDEEKNKPFEEKVEQQQTEDALDAYMSGLSSKLKIDTVERLQKEISTFQSELDRVLYLLKVADPTGDAAKKRLATAEERKSKNSEQSLATIKAKKLPLEKKKADNTEKLSNEPVEEKLATAVMRQENEVAETSQDVSGTKDSKTTPYTVVKPQWLGAVAKEETEKLPLAETSGAAEEGDQFVSYKDRSKILNDVDRTPVNNSGLENAAPGLILRKKKPVEKSGDGENQPSQQSTASNDGGALKAEDAVALLLKHKRGYHDMDEEHNQETNHNQPKKDKKKPKRVLGPEKPSFLEGNSDYDASWVPPEGQSGDGRTSLNDRLGY